MARSRAGPAEICAFGSPLPVPPLQAGRQAGGLWVRWREQAWVRAFSLPAFAGATRAHLPLREGYRMQLWRHLLQEVFPGLPASRLLLFPRIAGAGVLCVPHSRGLMLSQSRQLRNVEDRMNEGVDNPGPAGAPGLVSPASYPASWQLPWPPRGTRPEPQGSGQLRAPGIGGGVCLGQGVATGRAQEEENSLPGSVPGSGSWKDFWAWRAGGGEAIRAIRARAGASTTVRQAEAARRRAGGARTALCTSSQSPVGTPGAGSSAPGPTLCPAQGREGPALQLLSVPQSCGHHPIREWCGWWSEIARRPQPQATMPWGDLGPGVCFLKPQFPYLGSRIVCSVVDTCVCQSCIPPFLQLTRLLPKQTDVIFSLSQNPRGAGDPEERCPALGLGQSPVSPMSGSPLASVLRGGPGPRLPSFSTVSGCTKAQRLPQGSD